MRAKGRSWAGGAVGLALALGGALVAAGEDTVAAAPTPPTVNNGDTAWVLVSAALVMLMTPGLAFFYGGLVRKKNVLSVLMQCFSILCLVSVQWVVLGYSLAFGPDSRGVVGDLSWAMLRGVGLEPNGAYAPGVPHQAFMIFQAMFAVITPALILGAFAERMKFGAFCIFSLLWATLVYDPIAHWVWGVGGFLRAWGTLDFAGGIVVHINAGMAALAAALVLGPRLGYPDKLSPPHNLPFAVLGAGLLWFGWFGFNAGSALGSGSLATGAFVVTHIAGATAGVTWAVLDAVFNRQPTVLGTITGAVAGLAAVTPASGYIGVNGALLIGVGAAVFPYLAVSFLKPRLGYDDSLDAFGVHGIGGIWGTVAVGIFASKGINPAGADGLIHGGTNLIGVQLGATALTIAYTFSATWILLKVVDVTVGLRVGEHDERVGLDLTQHREAGYTIVD
jgi:Amt family ammonium transporter